MQDIADRQAQIPRETTVNWQALLQPTYECLDQKSILDRTAPAGRVTI